MRDTPCFTQLIQSCLNGLCGLCSLQPEAGKTDKSALATLSKTWDSGGDEGMQGRPRVLLKYRESHLETLIGTRGIFEARDSWIFLHQREQILGDCTSF